MKQSPLISMLNGYGKDGKNLKIRGSEVALLVKNYKNLIDLLPDFDNAAVAVPLASGKLPLTHKRLKEFVTKEFDLSSYGLNDGDRVSILLPNGPELAVAVVSVISRYCAAPINATNTWQEIKSELSSTQAKAIIILAGASANDAALQAADALGIGVLVITPNDTTCGIFRISELRPTPRNMPLLYPKIAKSVPGFQTYNHPETVLLLHTSGTSGNKKLVPYSLDMIIIGVGCIVSSWNLSADDVCLNMMPLFHIGGIMRNILSPILSGGSVIACNGFDPLLFWDILYTTQRVTWYYAAPTMHHALLQESTRRPAPLPVDSIRFIANAAGGLLPILAQGLRDTFHAVILTSYGMTECMPISSPPQTYLLDPVGTSGIPVGPEVIIVDESNTKKLPPGEKGNILVKGAPCFGGYENNGTANEESFFTIDHDPGWFNTGDMGYLDSNNYLFISGRSKEIINRGGETISPFEIEEVLIQHPLIKETLAFSAPHHEYQETVGAVIVSYPNQPYIDLGSLHHYLEDKLHRSKWPQILIYMNNLPKNAAGKILRIKLAERCQLKDINEESSLLTRIYEATCPKIGAPLTKPITITPIKIDLHQTEAFISSIDEVQHVVVFRMDLPFQLDTIVAFISIHPDKDNIYQNNTHLKEGKIQAILKACQSTLHGFLVPSHIHIVSSDYLQEYIEMSKGYEMSKIDDMTKASTNNNTSSSSSSSTYTYQSVPTSDHNNTIAHVTAIDKLKVLALKLFNESNIVAPRNAIETQIEVIWREQLNATSTISVVLSFFALGGDSLKAGKLVAAMRKKLEVNLSVADLFTAPTIEAMAHKVLLLKTMGSPGTGTSASGRIKRTKTPNSNLPNGQKPKYYSSLYQSIHPDEELGFLEDHHVETDKYASAECISPFSNLSPICLFIQALPLVVFYPIRRIIIWFLIAGMWVHLMKHGMGRFNALIVAMVFMRATLAICAPLIGIAAKWILIGRYQPGRYPLWGSMYLRWWLVEKVITVFGKGIFRDDIPILGPHLVRLYYVFMGATIGKNVKIHRDAKLGQADLLTIGDDVCIDNAVIRPFSIEEGYFVLLPITIGARCSIGVKSAVAAGSYLPPGTCLGPLSSSYEINSAESYYRDYCRTAFPSPPIWLTLTLGLPILIFVAIISRIPWYIGLKLMIYHAKSEGWYESHIHTILDAFLWWITPNRLAYYFLLRAIRRCVVPFIHLGVSILIKWYLIGTFTPMTMHEKLQPWNVFRYWLMARLLPGGQLGGVSKLVGTHYAIISYIYRLLGAKIGHRIYWPGSGLEIVEYDLLEVGDDVVFGSRSVVMTSSAKRSEKVTFEAGSMVADRCVILPGVSLRRGAVLGSGSLAAEDMDIPVGSVWVGSKDGCAVNVAPSDQSYATSDTMTPFGRAFYQHKASYYVLPLWIIVVYNTLWQAFCTCYRNALTPLALVICQALMILDQVEYHPYQLFKYTLYAFIPLHVTLSLFALIIDIVSKYLLLGTRKQGSYAWDESSYCQRWQIYLTIQEIRRSERRRTGILDMIEGSQYLVWYFQALGAKIGDNVCLYPNGGDPMMTEPDLVTIGDNCSIDDASLIAHINTRGTFRLNPLVVGDGSVCKSNTRLLSGATMESHSVMLEHTLVLAGETVDYGTVWQGWPSTTQIPLEKYRESIKKKVLETIKKKKNKTLTSSSSSSSTSNDILVIGGDTRSNSSNSDNEHHSNTPTKDTLKLTTTKSNTNTLNKNAYKNSAGDLEISAQLYTTNKNSEKQPLLSGIKKSSYTK